jgi:hypothetical protein
MKKTMMIMSRIACIVGLIVGIWHFFVPYSSEWFSYIPSAPTEIYQSINYVNFCFSFLLAGFSLLLLVMQERLFEGLKELRIFYAFFNLLWLSRIIIQLVWPWPSGLQLWLVVAFSVEFVLSLIPMAYLAGTAARR